MNPLIKVVRVARDLPLPSYQTAGAAGMDLYAAVPGKLGYLIVHPGERRLIPCGFRMQIPEGYEGQVRGRSGLRIKYGVTCPVGTIDSDYRGEMAVILFNLGERYFRVNRGDRIAQLVIAPVVRAVLDEVVDLDETTRGEQGFGSTGRK